jgi:hypothetical protein
LNWAELAEGEKPSSNLLPKDFALHRSASQIPAHHKSCIDDGHSVAKPNDFMFSSLSHESVALLERIISPNAAVAST